MNDLGYGQLSNPDRSLKLVLMRVEIIENSFSDIFTTLAKDFIASHPFICRVLTVEIEFLLNLVELKWSKIIYLIKG